MLLHHLGKVNWNALGELVYSVKTGEDAFSKLYGKTSYEYLRENSRESAIFDNSMSDLTKLAIGPLLGAYDFSQFGTIADIGGGEGLFLAAILLKHHTCEGILFDLPEAVNNAPQVFRENGLVERVAICEGNFFQSIPTGADLYILKNVIHNWGDEECLILLNNIKKTLPPNGKVLIIEMVIHDDNRTSFGKLIDIQMLATMPAGSERTLQEYKDMINRSGLRLERVITTIAPLYILEISSKKTNTEDIHLL